MAFGTQGLTGVKTKHLKQLLGAIHRSEVTFPLDRVQLTIAGVQSIGDDVAILRGLDEAAVKAVIITALSERAATSRSTRS